MIAKNRSRILILSHIAQFSLGREVGGVEYSGLKGSRFRESEEPAIGSLVAVSAAPPSKWYLSWMHETIRHYYDDGRRYEREFLLESIEDGELCKWGNVSLWEYDKSQVYSHPEWRWTDEQHFFNDKWRRYCLKERDAYIVLPTQAVFSENYVVTVGTRTRYGIDDHRPVTTFKDWRKVTKSQLLAFYDKSVADQNAKPTARTLGIAATSPTP